MKQLSPSAFVRIPCFDLMVFAEMFSKSYIIAHSHIPIYSSVVIYTCKYIDYTYNKSLFSILFIYIHFTLSLYNTLINSGLCLENTGTNSTK